MLKRNCKVGILLTVLLSVISTSLATYALHMDFAMVNVIYKDQWLGQRDQPKSEAIMANKFNADDLTFRYGPPRKKMLLDRKYVTISLFVEDGTFAGKEVPADQVEGYTITALTRVFLRFTNEDINRNSQGRFSVATLTFYLKPASPPVDKTALQALVDEVNGAIGGIQQIDTQDPATVTAGVEFMTPAEYQALQEALTAGQDTLANTQATQEQVDLARENLQKAYDAKKTGTMKYSPNNLEKLKQLYQSLMARLPNLRSNAGKPQLSVPKSEDWMTEAELQELEKVLEQVGALLKDPSKLSDEKINDFIDKLTEEEKKIQKGTKPEQYELSVEYFEDVEGKIPSKDHAPFSLKIEHELVAGLTDTPADIDKCAKKIQELVKTAFPEGYTLDQNSCWLAAKQMLSQTATKAMTIKIYRTPKPGKRLNIVAFDIRNGEWVYDRVYGLRMRDGWTSVSDMARAFYQNSETVQKDYLYAGFVTKDLKPCVLLREAYLENPERWKEEYLKLLEETKADIVVLVVPKTMGITVEHIFPEGTQASLMETVNVPYIEWASLQTSSQFMILPEIFRTRIQKVNEQGYAFQEIRFYSRLEEVTGVLGAWDWAGMDLGDHTKKECKAKVFYQLAPENRVQAQGQGKVQTQVGTQVQSSAQAKKQVPGQGQMQAQIKVQGDQKVQGPIAVAGASMSNQGKQVNGTLPVTGASDSIFLFLSSAALMAVGILFFKKH